MAHPVSQEPQGQQVPQVRGELPELLELPGLPASPVLGDCRESGATKVSPALLALSDLLARLDLLARWARLDLLARWARLDLPVGGKLNTHPITSNHSGRRTKYVCVERRPDRPRKPL